jgi:hypothetical protein
MRCMFTPHVAHRAALPEDPIQEPGLVAARQEEVQAPYRVAGPLAE